MKTKNRGGHHAIFPNATVEKLEGTVLVGPWCGGKTIPHSLVGRGFLTL